MPRVIAYYTHESQYQQLVKKLEVSCEKFGVACYTEGFVDRGKWEHNCAIKPEFILGMLKKYPGETLIYIDADAVIKKQPELFKTFDMDFACHFRRNQLLSGTLFFNSNERTIALVEAWVKKQQEDPNIWDQKVLQRTLREFDVDVFQLPATYCKIFDAQDQKGDPVIEHYQASRKIKRERKKHDDCPLPKQAKGLPDGSIILTHERANDIKFMDLNFKRRHPNETRWLPVLTTLEEANLNFKGQTGYIIGKGPSLDKLSPNDFDDTGPIIAVNEAIFKLEQLDLENQTFLVQDPALREFAKPTKITVILEERICGFYRIYPNKLQYSRINMGLPHKVLSAIVAIRILKQWGVTRIVMLAFDACINEDTRYAKIVGYPSDEIRPAKRFLGHKPQLIKNLADIDYSFRLAGKMN